MDPTDGRGAGPPLFYDPFRSPLPQSARAPAGRSRRPQRRPRSPMGDEARRELRRQEVMLDIQKLALSARAAATPQ